MRYVLTSLFLALSVICFAGKITSVSIETRNNTFHSKLNQDSSLAVSFLVEEAEEIVSITGQIDTAVKEIDIHTSAEYTVLDSLTRIGDSFYCKIQFRDVVASRFLKLILSVDKQLETIKLEPYTDAVVELRPSSNKLIIGEQQVVTLYSAVPSNILPSKRWIETPDYDYYIRIKNNSPKLLVQPKRLGIYEFNFELNLRQPILIDSTPTRVIKISEQFEVQRSNLVFLNLEQPEYILTNEAKTEGIKTLIDNNIQLKQGYTYRITDSEGRDEVLIGELFVPKKINRGRAEALLKLYNYHQRRNGYLYIKDVDRPVFVTNFTVRPETSIHNVYLQRSDGDWKLDNIIFPGENLRVKLEGTSLLGEPVYFDGQLDAQLDSLLSDDSKLVYNISIPKNISSRKIDIFRNKKSFGKFLEVNEVQIPRKFDFVTLDFGNGKKRVSDLSKPVQFYGSLKYFSLIFNENKIDESADLHGKQYINIRVTMYDKNRKMIESREIGPLAICPGENSVRYHFYPKEDCAPSYIELNDYLHNHTANLDDWSSVEIEIKHAPEKYDLPVLYKKVEVILARKVNYDLDLSFPTGLLTKEFGDDAPALNNFSGISLAMVAQISFYKKNQIAKYRPYKLGVGFLAFNMFSMSAEVEDRDLGLVILGSLYPSTKDRRLSFPLFLGGGYFLSHERFFLLVGPGIRISI